MNLKLKAAAIVVAMIGGSFVVGRIFSYLTPQAIMWICIAGLLYVMYNLVLSYLTFSNNVDNLNNNIKTREEGKL